jgi:hypothetical protein
MDGSIDVALCRKMDDGARLVLCDQGVDKMTVADIAVSKDMAGIVCQRGQVFKVASVSELIEIDDRLITLGKPVENKICADETGTTSDQDRHA